MPPATSSQTGERARPLRAGQFQRIAGNGFGDGANSYAYSYEWFDDHVYIGTNRNILVLIKRRSMFDVPLSIWPVPLPDEIDPSDQCAEIWRYHPPTRVWERVYRSALTRGVGDREVPVATGFRNMAVFQGRSDPAPALYTIPNCGSFGIGPVLHRCLDGKNFEIASEPGMELGDSNVTSFRGVVPFKGRLFVTPAGSRGFNPNISYNATILCSDDPVCGRWEASCAPCFGDPTNVSIHDMAVFGDHLYAGTMNVRHGCELWKTDGEGRPPHRWTRVFDRGADRGPYNEAVVSMVGFRGHLYVGTGIQNGGHDRTNNIGPGAGEVLRVDADDRWELVVGQARMTRDGLRLPTSGLGPGFDNPFAGYIWRMCTHEGCIYVGTYDSSSLLPFVKEERLGAGLDPATLERFMAFRGGCEVWRSADGDHWVPVTCNGFGNSYNFGIRAFVSTPHGLFIGTANPFGPRVAVRHPTGFRYEPNPHGGVEVWHGAADACLPAEGRELRLEGADEAVLPAVSSAGAPPSHIHLASDLETEEAFAKLLDPLVQLAGTDLDCCAGSVQDELDAYFGGDLHAAGLWSDGPTDSPQRACQALVEELASLLPAAQDEAPGPSVLVVAESAPAVAWELRRLRPDLDVTLLLFADERVQQLRQECPDLPLVAGRPAAFALPAACFDAVLWLEGPSVEDRVSALREVWRVLTPGGRLLAADLITDPGRGAESKDLLALYERDLAACGFGAVSLTDITRSGWTRFFRHSRQYFGTRLLLLQIDLDRHAEILEALPGGTAGVAGHLLVQATRSEAVVGDSPGGGPR